VTGPTRILWSRRATGQPSVSGIPMCYRPLGEESDGSMCALAYAPADQQKLMASSPGCERCQAGCRAALLYYTHKDTVG
jgi:hypothetical protein